jgi:predicted DNA-binding mobile mystery protein A
MFMTKDILSLRIKQIDQKIKKIDRAIKFEESRSWINDVRLSLGMSLEQLGKRMNMTPQGVKRLEQRERDGSITLKTLNQAARAFGFGFGYGFTTSKTTLEDLVYNQALMKSKEIVRRANRTMVLENQANSKKRLENSVKELRDEIIKNKPKYLWD